MIRLCRECTFLNISKRWGSEDSSARQRCTLSGCSSSSWRALILLRSWRRSRSRAWCVRWRSLIEVIWNFWIEISVSSIYNYYCSLLSLISSLHSNVPFSYTVWKCNMRPSLATFCPQVTQSSLRPRGAALVPFVPPKKKRYWYVFTWNWLTSSTGLLLPSAYMCPLVFLPEKKTTLWAKILQILSWSLVIKC